MSEQMVTRQAGLKFIAVFLAVTTLCYFLFYLGSNRFVFPTSIQANNKIISQLSFLSAEKNISSLHTLKSTSQAFTDLTLSHGRYSLSPGNYWLRVTVKNNSNKNISMVLFSDNALVNIVPSNKVFKEVASKSTPVLEKIAYPYHGISVAPLKSQQYFMKIENTHSLTTSLFWSSAQYFEQHVLVSQLLNGAFMMLVVLLILYHFKIFIQLKDQATFSYLLVLLTYSLILSSLTGNGYFIFGLTLQHFFSQYLIIANFCLLISLLLFSVFYLCPNSNKNKIIRLAFGLSALLLITSFYTVSLDLQTQELLLHVGLLLSGILILCACWQTKNNTLVTSYIITLPPLLLIYFYQGTGIQSWFFPSLSVQPSIEASTLNFVWLNTNSYLCLSMLHISLMAMALNKKIRVNKLNKAANLLRYAGNGMLKASVIDSKISQMIDSKNNHFTLITFMPKKLDTLVNYINDNSYQKLIKDIHQSLEKLTSNNKSILLVSSESDKLCLIDNCTFALLHLTDSQQQSLSDVLSGIQKKVNQHFCIDQLVRFQGIETGLASYPVDGKNSAQLLKNAQHNLQSSLISGSSSGINSGLHSEINMGRSALKISSYYDHETHYKTDFYLQLASDLAQALCNDSCAIYHQPQIDLNTLRVCSSECLLRWHHPREGELSPKLLIALAEDFGLLNQLTLWVIKQSLVQQVILRDEYDHNHMLSINISGNELCSDSFFEHTLQLIESSTISSDKIVFEITQWQSINHPDKAFKTISKLTELGITISSDDINSLYSAVLNDQQCCYQELKLKQPWVNKAGQSQQGKLAVNTMIKMAKGSSLEVVAEGIISQKDEDMLRELGCDIGQGHFYGKAMNFTNYLEWLSQLTNGRIRQSLQGDFIPAGN